VCAPATDKFRSLARCTIHIYRLCLECVLDVYLEARKKAVKRVQVSFTRGQWDIIDRFKATMGETDADIVRNIILAWLSEKSVITSDVKRKIEAERV